MIERYMKDGKAVGWTLEPMHPYEPRLEALVELRKCASGRVEYWSQIQKDQGRENVDLARWAAGELKRAKKEVRILNELRDVLLPLKNGSIPNKVWANDDGFELTYFYGRICN